MGLVKGWRKVPNAAAGVEAMAISTGDGTRDAYVLGVGATDTGRISTSTRAGAALTIPDGYSFGEMIELRYTFEETGNSTVRGLFMEVRHGVANSATVSGMEVTARQSAAVSIGTLEGINGRANIASTSTGNITAAFGVTGEININSANYTGTITLQAGLRAKVQVEDGSTLTAGTPASSQGSYGIFVSQEGISGPVLLMDAVIGATATNQSTASFNSILNTTGVLTTVSDTDQTLLWKFLNSSGTTIFMRYDQSAGGLVFATS